jgi:hypothetical protein
MSRFRLLGYAGALVLAALLGGTIMSAVAAAPAAPPVTEPALVPTAEESAKPAAAGGTDQYCQAFRAAFAAELGVQESALAPAAKDAAIATIERAVTAGDLTRAVGDRLIERVKAADPDPCRWFRPWTKRIHGPVGVTRDAVGAAATALDMTRQELRAQLKAGKTLKDVAAAEGVPYETVSAAVVAAVKADLDAAVAAKRITQARADRILERLQANLAEGRLRGARRERP